jgi:hypothetical protein
MDHANNKMSLLTWEEEQFCASLQAGDSLVFLAVYICVWYPGC